MRLTSPFTAFLLAASLAACSGETPGDAPGDSAAPAAYRGPGTPVPRGPDAGRPSTLPGEVVASQQPVRADLARVDVPASVHDFGEVWQGGLLEHVFKLTVNEGPDLVVSKVVPGCSCTLAEIVVLGEGGARTPYVTGAPLPAGTELEVAIEMHTEQRFGEQFKQPRLYANVPGGVIILTLQCQIRVWLDVKPVHWNAGRMATTEQREGAARIVGTAGVPFALSVDTNGLDEHLAVELTPEDPADDGRATVWNARIVVGPGLPRGALQMPIVFESDAEVEGHQSPEGDEPVHHKAALLVRAEIVGLVTATPPSMGFGVLRPDVLVSKSVLVTSADPEHLLAQPTWELVTPDGEPFGWGDHMQVTARPYPPSGSPGAVEGERQRSWSLELTIDGLPEGIERIVRGRLLIHTDHPSEPELSVNFTGFTNNVLGTHGETRGKPGNR